MEFRCSECGGSLAASASVWRCPCGGVLELAGPPAPLEPARWTEGPSSVWRYRQAFPFPAEWDGWQCLTMGEGMTPLVPVGPAAGAGGVEVLAKVDYVMPTLSFKDRGAVVLMASAASLGVTAAVADSSGNAGAAVAAYSARAGIALEVFVPAGTSTRKVGQIGSYGAVVRVVDGDRRAAADAAAAAVDAGGRFYASHVYNPWFLEGTQTFAWEIWEQLGGRVPGTIVLPAGNGTLVLGAARGFARLRDGGLAPGVPRILAVQAEGCAPLARAWARGLPDPVPVAARPTAAEGVAVARPPRGAQVLAAVAASGGSFASVSEEEIAGARFELARGGLAVEPTGAVAWAGARIRLPDLAGPVVVALGGASAKAD